jgi:eukaryotic-like serine/threonine-protein kinase
VADDKKTQIGSPGAVANRAVARVSQAPPSVTATASVTGATSYVPESTDALVGQTLVERYLVKKKLGEGGMGAVYLATHKLLEKQVALKVLHGEFARKPELVERFMQEAKSASRIRHENVIDISDFGVTPDGLVFFAMELLQGSDLHGVIGEAKAAGQLLPWARSRPIFLQIAAALIAAHGHGIIHRDLKPENIYLVEFLGQPDFVKLLDFGIAKLTEVNEGDRKLTKTGMLFGTPEYMAPEQARGDQADVRVDVYAMACILFQLVTGRVPFEAENFMGVLTMHLTEPPPPIDGAVLDAIGAPRGLAAIINKGLEKNRDQRWQNMTDFANALRILHGESPLSTATTRSGDRVSVSMPVLATKPTSDGWRGAVAIPNTTAAVATKGRSKKLWMIGAATLIALSAGGIVVATRTNSTPTPPVAPPSATPLPPPKDVAVQAPTPQLPFTPPAAIPTTVTVKISSEPAGAMIFANGGTEKLGKTPQTISSKGSATPRYYLLKLRGYKDVTMEVPLLADIEQNVKLEKGEGSVTRPATTATKPNDGKPNTPTLKPGSNFEKPVPVAGPTVVPATPEKPETKPDVKAEPKPDKPATEDDDMPTIKRPDEIKPGN